MFCRKGSVIVLFTIEFKNDTNVTHSDESINAAFQEALLNASSFTNLTLDVNNSKIGRNRTISMFLIRKFIKEMGGPCSCTKYALKRRIVICILYSGTQIFIYSLISVLEHRYFEYNGYIEV